MLIERKRTADLIPADYNPRKDLKPGDPEYDKLKRSMEQFGYVEPVIWNKTTGRVVGGHQRLKVLMDMGVTEVECVVVELDEEREKALNIALNKISGDWDKDKLMLLISDLQGADFDVSLTGFDPAEIDDLFKDSLKDGVKDDEFDVDAELQKPTITKAGDVWTLGRHRLVCGDSTKPETFSLLMDGLKANLVITDPPYNVNYEGGAGKIKNGADSCPSIAIYEDEIKPLLLQVFRETEADAQALVEEYVQMYKSLHDKGNYMEKIQELQQQIELEEKKKLKLLGFNAAGELPDRDFLAMNKTCTENIERAQRLIHELEEQQLSKNELKQHIDTIRRVLEHASQDAAQGVINKEFVDKYIDKIFVTPQDDGTLHLQIKIFTGEVTDKFLESLRSRTGHTFKKMIEAYENGLK